MEIIHDKLKNIKAFVFDVDGVMTEGSVFATEDGQFLRTFNIKELNKSLNLKTYNRF